MNFDAFSAQRTFSGTIRWHRSIGIPIFVPPHVGLRVTYHYTYAAQPLDWESGRHREISHAESLQVPTMDFDRDGDEYVVGFWGSNMVNEHAEHHSVEARVRDLPWSGGSRHQPFRLVDPARRTFVPAEAVTVLEPFEVYAPVLGVDL